MIKPIYVRRHSKPEDLQDRMIDSDEGYSSVDIDTELPYLMICDEFEAWLAQQEAVDQCRRLAEMGFEYS